MAVLPFGARGSSRPRCSDWPGAGGDDAVLMILSPGALTRSSSCRSASTRTIAANIALQFPEADPLGVSTLIATGLALFVITLA